MFCLVVYFPGPLHGRMQSKGLEEKDMGSQREITPHVKISTLLLPDHKIVRKAMMLRCCLLPFSKVCTGSNDVKMLSPPFPFSTPPLRTFPRRCEFLGKLTTSCCCRVVPLLQIFGNLPKIDPSMDRDVVI